MTTSKKLTGKRTAGNARLELARLIAEQKADSGRSTVRRRATLSYDDDRAASAPRGSVRLSGDELRDHVLWLARRALKEAGCVLPVELAARVALERSKRDVDRRAIEIHRGLLATIEQARSFVREHAPRDGGLALDELREVLRVLEPLRERMDWKSRFPTLAALMHDTIGFRRALSLRPDRLPDVPDLLGVPSRQEPSPRSVIARELEGAPWTHRLRGCASLLAGNWPPEVEQHRDDSFAPDEVIRLETDAVRNHRRTRRRRRK